MSADTRSAASTIAVVGTGSVGRRHARNLLALGASVVCVDPRADRLAQAAQELPALGPGFDSIEAMLQSGIRLQGGVIASPPSVHVDQTTQLIRRSIPVLLEKPVSPDLASADRLQRLAEASGVGVLLGYTYRWWPPFLALREELGRGVVGRPRHARIIMSAHLADWHPWERYQDFFMASRELGGGALLDESHFIDLMIWLFGMPQSIAARVEHLSSLEITTDDNVDLLAVYPDNFRVSLHLDLFGRPHAKSVTIVGEEGTIECHFDPHRLRSASGAAGPWKEALFDVDRNDMFVGVAREFLAMIDGGAAPSCTIADGVRVLRCVEAARESSATERTVAVESR